MRIKVPGLGRFQVIPGGDYHARIVEVTPDTTNTGKELLQVVFEVIGPIQVGARLACQLYLTERAVWKLNDLLAAVGVEPRGGEVETEELMNREVRIHVKEERDPSRKLGKSEVVRFESLGEKKSATDLEAGGET